MWRASCFSFRCYSEIDAVVGKVKNGKYCFYDNLHNSYRLQGNYGTADREDLTRGASEMNPSILVPKLVRSRNLAIKAEIVIRGSISHLLSISISY